VCARQVPGATGAGGPLVPGTAFADFQAARERFFEALRRDSELRRLEAAWRLEPRPPHGPERASGEAPDRGWTPS